ncbi:tetraspanin-33-like [Xyrauchen texanus]|uniref:tetraspanin-33-like n=1 Tax=Xyrauchen texanus TaxID=154827 RepID=UPI0022424499|nr:tetraspanin-33-like [Xyrauchen texanus]
MRGSSTDETPYRRSPSLESKPGSPPLHYSGEYEYHSSPFVFGIHTTPGSKKDNTSYTTAQGRKYVVFYLDLSFIFLLELWRCKMAEGCLRALRYGMVFFNLLFWLGGCGILGIGVWLAITQGNFATLSSSLPSMSAANLLIALGSIVMVIGCLGCVGAVKENRPLLLSFFILLLFILLLEILFIILFFTYQDKCYYCPLTAFNKTCKHVLSECPAQELCFTADGRFGRASVLFTKGCMTKSNCIRSNSSVIRGNNITFTYSCCDQDYCNSNQRCAYNHILLTVTAITGLQMEMS